MGDGPYARDHADGDLYALGGVGYDVDRPVFLYDSYVSAWITYWYAGDPEEDEAARALKSRSSFFSPLASLRH